MSSTGEVCLVRRKTFPFSGAWSLAFAIAAMFGSLAVAQKTQDRPATDSSAQASPIQATPHAPVTDSAQQASPIPSGNGQGTSIAPHTQIELKLGRSIDSGRLQNGETVPATLSKPIALSPKGALDAGTPAVLTVVETLPAGRIYAAGEFSLQVERVGSILVSTDTLTYRGQPGHKDLPDSAPAMGTDAGLAAGAQLVFHVLPPPEPAKGPPSASNGGPGSVDGEASGSPPPQGSSAQPAANAKKTNASAQSETTSAETTQPHL